MDKIPGVTERSFLLTNDDGLDDEDEWHLIDFGRDEDFLEMWGIYKRWRDGRGYAYGGGWAEQLAIQDEIIDLFIRLDASIEKPKSGE